MKIFVYGTLKTNHGNWHRLLRNRAVFVGHAKTVDTYKMLKPAFPVIVDDLDGHPVRGEVFECDDATVHDLDMLEGEGHMYHRRLVCAQFLDGRPAEEVSIYIGGDHWLNQRHEVVQPDADGLLTWNIMDFGQLRSTVSNLLEDDDEQDDSHWDDEPEVGDEYNDEAYDVDDDPGEVVEPEDQNQGDVLGLEDEREEP